MAKKPKQDYDKLWYHEISKLQSRINTLKARGVEVHYSLTKPEKVVKRDIEQIRKIKQFRLIKGVSNKQVQVNAILPPTLKVNRLGKLVAKEKPKLSPSFKATNISIEKALKRDEAKLEKITLDPSTDVRKKSEAVRKAEKATGVKATSWSFEPDDDEIPERIIKPNKPTKIRTTLEETVEKAKAESVVNKVQDTAAEVEGKKSKRELIQEAAKKAAEKKAQKLPTEEELQAERAAQQIELENAAARAEIEAEKKWRKENPKHHKWKKGEASEKALKQIERDIYGEDDIFSGYETEEEIQSKLSYAGEYKGLKSNQEAFYVDTNTGTRYRTDDSRILLRDAAGHIKHDINGKPIIKPMLELVVTEPLDRKSLSELRTDLLKNRYASMASDRGQIVTQFIEDLLDEFDDSDVFLAFNALASTNAGDITFADIYEGKGGSLATKLSKVISHLPQQNQKRGREILKKYVEGTKKTGRRLKNYDDDMTIMELDEAEEGGWESPE